MDTKLGQHVTFVFGCLSLYMRVITRTHELQRRERDGTVVWFPCRVPKNTIQLQYKEGGAMEMTLHEDGCAHQGAVCICRCPPFWDTFVRLSHATRLKRSPNKTEEGR